MRTREGVMAVLSALSVAACASGGVRWTGTIRDSAGVAVVANTDIGIWAPGEEWRLQEEVRLGMRQDPQEPRLGLVGDGGIAVDSRGRIHVLDRQEQHILVYLPDGTYQQTVPVRRGGRGRWGGALRVFMGPGDTLMVMDGQNLQVGRYAPDGSPVGSFAIRLEEGFPMGFVGTSGGVMAEQIRRVPVPGQPPTERRMDAIVLLAADGARTDTLLTFPSGENQTLDGRGRQYAPEPIWDLTDRLQLILGVTGEYRIALFSGTHLDRVFTKPFALRAVGDSDRAADLRELERRWADIGMTAEGLKRMRDNFSFAEFLPVFHRLTAGPMGTIWVQHIASPAQLSDLELASFRTLIGWGRPEWDVFNSGGRFLGVVRGPLGFFPVLFRGNEVYGVQMGENDRQYVLKLRIVGTLGAGAT